MTAETITVTEVAAPTKSGRLTVPAMFIFAMVLGFTGTLAIQLPNLRLHEIGVSGMVIGMSTACQAMGIVAGALGSVILLRFVGSATLMSSGCLLAALSLLALGQFGDVTWTSVWRFVMATGTGAVLTVAEYVLIARAPLSRRATALAFYASFALLGSALAPALIATLGTTTSAPLYMTCAAMTALALAPYIVGVRNRIDANTGQIGDLRMVVFLPVMFIPALAFGMMDGGLIEMMNIYLITRDLTVPLASIVVLSAIAGALFLQVPLAAASDRYGHEKLLSAVWSVIILALGFIYFAQSIWLLVFAAFILGGACDALYSIGFATLADNLPTSKLATANGCFVATCGVGEVIGPVLSGVSLHVANGTGFILAFMLIGFIGLLLAHRSRHVTKTIEHVGSN